MAAIQPGDGLTTDVIVRRGSRLYANAKCDTYRKVATQAIRHVCHSAAGE